MISQLALPRVAAPGSGDGARGALQLLRVGSIMRSREQQADGPKPAPLEGEKSMVDSVYKIIELVGTSTESWEKAAGAAVAQAAKSLRDLRIVEVVQLDMQVQNGKVKTYRAKVKVSFKFEGKK
jgi:flavin-binding protein dodecin